MDITTLREELKQLLLQHTPPLRVRHDKPDQFEVCGTKPQMQGKQKVDGFYFASLVPKPKDVRLYFFPIYTHADQFDDLAPELRKQLNGKSCFHLKPGKTDLNMLNDMIAKGIRLYEKDDLI